MPVCAHDKLSASFSGCHKKLTDLRFEPTNHLGVVIEADGKVCSSMHVFTYIWYVTRTQNLRAYRLTYSRTYSVSHCVTLCHTESLCFTLCHNVLQCVTHGCDTYGDTFSCVSVCVSVCMCVCVCVCARDICGALLQPASKRDRERQRETERDREKERKRERERERERLTVRGMWLKFLGKPR